MQGYRNLRIANNVGPRLIAAGGVLLVVQLNKFESVRLSCLNRLVNRSRCSGPVQVRAYVPDPADRSVRKNRVQVLPRSTLFDDRLKTV